MAVPASLESFSHDALRLRLAAGRKDTIEVDTMFLSVAVGDKASLELVD